MQSCVTNKKNQIQIIETRVRPKLEGFQSSKQNFPIVRSEVHWEKLNVCKKIIHVSKVLFS